MLKFHTNIYSTFNISILLDTSQHSLLVLVHRARPKMGHGAHHCSKQENVPFYLFDGCPL